MKTAPGLIVIAADFRFIRAFPVLNDGSETDHLYKQNAERILLQSVAASTMSAHLAAAALGMRCGESRPSDRRTFRSRSSRCSAFPTSSP